MCTTDRGGLKVDRDFFWGAILFSFLFIVGCVLQRAEPVRMRVRSDEDREVGRRRARAKERGNENFRRR